MKPWKLAVGVAALLWGCGVRAVTIVDRIEDGVPVLLDEQGRRVMPPGGGESQDLPEGTVLVDGRPDPAERSRLIDEIARRRQKLLDDDGSDLVLGGRP